MLRWCSVGIWSVLQGCLRLVVVTLDSLRDSSVYKERAMRAVKAQRSVVAMGDAQGAWGSGGASGAAGVAQCAMFKETLILYLILIFTA